MAQIEDLIQQAGGKAEEAVTAAKTRYLDQVRAVLRDLTRLKFTDRQGVESQHTSVPIRVVAGLPEPLKQIGEETLPSGEQLGIEKIGMWAQDIKALDAVARRLEPLVGALGQIPEWEKQAKDYRFKLSGASILAKELEEYAAKAALLKRISQINEDILGVYMPTARLIPDKGQIELYWVVIGAVARLLGVDTEALAVVVMAHELAHAYTHLGLDSNGSRWEDNFWNCDRGILEGLAQYYTHMTAEAMKEERGYDKVWTAYDRMTQLQRDNKATLYVNHLAWVKDISPEAMRFALLDLRRGHLDGDFEYFSKTLTLLAERYAQKPRKTRS